MAATDCKERTVAEDTNGGQTERSSNDRVDEFVGLLTGVKIATLDQLCLWVY
jgi:hypothetical protein